MYCFLACENDITLLIDLQLVKQAARYDDIDDLISLASAGVSLDSKDSQGRTGDNLEIHDYKLLLIAYF